MCSRPMATACLDYEVGEMSLLPKWEPDGQAKAKCGGSPEWGKHWMVRRLRCCSSWLLLLHGRNKAPFTFFCISIVFSDIFSIIPIFLFLVGSIFFLIDSIYYSGKFNLNDFAIPHCQAFLTGSFNLKISPTFLFLRNITLFKWAGQVKRFRCKTMYSWE